MADTEARPFEPGGIFEGGDVRLGGPTKDDDVKDQELRESMETAGYLPGNPVITDEHGDFQESVSDVESHV